MFSYVIFTEFFKLFDDVNLQPSLISRPCFLKSLNVSLATSLSAMKRKSSIASITVTFEPNLAHTLPNSSPITPAPITPKVSGTLSISRAPVLSNIFVSLKIAEPISIGDEPDAIMIFFDSIISFLPSISVICTLLSAKTLPLPAIGVTLFAANNPPIPPVNLATISFFLFIIAGISKSTEPTSIP